MTKLSRSTLSMLLAYARRLEVVANYYNCEYEALPISFKEDYEVTVEGKIRYNNTILSYYEGKKKPFDILVLGRRRRDFVDRFKFSEEDLPSFDRIKRYAENNCNCLFPYWEV